jgi:XTP/dITP diphosphohydrolase
MPKLIPGTRLVVASHNPGKVREILDLVAPYGLSVVSAGELGLPEPEETGTTFAANAELKALAAAKAAGLPALADDSGLEVFGLGGAPGVYSARWAGPDKDFGAAMERVWRELQEKGAGDISARFVCVLALAQPDGSVDDPIFVPDGHTRTFGEMRHEEKLPLTHRARAFEKFVAALA